MIERMRRGATVVPRRTGLVHRMVASATNYRLAMVTDLMAATAFLAFGVHRFVGDRVVAGALILVGFFACGLLEYAVHRWILHGALSMARGGHARHHAEPTALIATPLFVILTASLAIWGLLDLVCPPGSAALLVFGLYAGYNYFALLHHWEHRHGPHVAARSYWRRLDRLHHLHHQQQVVNFGISTTIWDRVFGTLQPTASRSPRAPSITRRT